MELNVSYTVNSAGANEIYEHLLLCDDHFFPLLSSRVNLRDYSEKLVSKAINFEAWQKGRLVGLVAAYVNDPNKDSAFVSNVSVLPDLNGRGIGRELIQQCVEYVRAQKYRNLVLEVSKHNEPAIGLYRKVGFKDSGEVDGGITMCLTFV